MCLLNALHGFWAGGSRVYLFAGFACGAPEEVLSFNFVDCFYFVLWPELHEFMTGAVVHVLFILLCCVFAVYVHGCLSDCSFCG